uniref:Ribosomal_L28e domain-containing protein n=1 Tax=Anopheles maculatus TaxID=74869 RepID=A0A182T7K7_9DIPT
MHRYELTGNILNPKFCSFRGKGNVCRNEDNLTGICSRQACPIVYTQYATVREEHGAIFLYMKRVNRHASPPGYHWEKLKLSCDSNVAVYQLKEHLLMQSLWIKNKCMEDFWKITIRWKNRQKCNSTGKLLEKHSMIETRTNDWLQEQRIDLLKTIMYNESSSARKKLEVDSVVNEELELEFATAKCLRFSRELNLYEPVEEYNSDDECTSDAYELASEKSGCGSNLCLDIEDCLPSISLCPINRELDDGYTDTVVPSKKSHKSRKKLVFEVEGNPPK